MNMNQSLKSVFVNWKNFSGRASRSEFWWFTLCSAFIKYFYDVSTTLLDIIVDINLLTPPQNYL